MLFYRISIFIDFNKHKFVDLYFSEQSKCKVRPQIVNINSKESVFFSPLVSKQANADVVATISIIHTQN